MSDCECGHPQSDHEYNSAQECAFGWTNEPHEEPCDCERYEPKP